MGWSTRAGAREREYPSTTHRALPAEPGSGADGPHDRLLPGWVSVGCGPPLTAGVRHCDAKDGSDALRLCQTRVLIASDKESSDGSPRVPAYTGTTGVHGPPTRSTIFAPPPGHTPPPATPRRRWLWRQRPAAACRSGVQRGLDRQISIGAGNVSTVPSREGLGTAGFGKLGGPVAATGQAGQSARVARADLRLIHRGLGHCRSARGQGAAEGTGKVA